MIKFSILLLVAAFGTSCASTGNLTFSGDLTQLGIPAQFSYQSGGKNPISSK